MACDKELNRHIAGIKREIRDLMGSIHAVIGYGKDAEYELNRLASKLEELEKEIKNADSD